MKEQNFKNHTRYHVPYHFIGLPIILAAFIGAIVNLVFAFSDGESVWPATLLLVGVVGLVITFILVREYILKLQDRVIRTEENLRAYVLTGRLLDSNLTIDQIIALRFASDEEFPTLCEKAVKENLKRNQIKKDIVNWRGDYFRA
ncbi:DUF6526 family protein [Cytobacillus sp. IB215665]|uniref:DUF6526 family protein n=1 Tax=Cytobacillus sp. IB215665 TaxID=3097357 RepID=UPI002A0C4E29|nr:DUF6526 family protein [Cytobacillus sp. IB215665]MDX8365878.1 DUF6526 family protein [Cytobacillus sp. IB215665]